MRSGKLFNSNRRYRTGLLILIYISVAGCQKVINVDLNDAAPRIVIEGLITDEPGPYAVMISKSGSFFNEPELQPVSGAIAIISDDTGIIDTLKEKRPGLYLTSKIQGKPGRTYTLKVNSEGVSYTGSSAMMTHVQIDSLGLIKNQDMHFDLGGNDRKELNIEMNCFFKDPLEKNFYRIKVTINDTIRPDNYRLYDDQYTNGQQIGLRIANANAGHTYMIELCSLDKSTFGYYRTLADLLHSNPIFGSTPANPDTNLDNGALGYFGTSAVSVKIVTITEAMLSAVK
jgi:hypothetical protein